MVPPRRSQLLSLIVLAATVTCGAPGDAPLAEDPAASAQPAAVAGQAAEAPTDADPGAAPAAQDAPAADAPVAAAAPILDASGDDPEPPPPPAPARYDDETAAAGPVVPTSWLVLAPVDDRGRRPLRPDAVLATHLLDPRGAFPVEGQVLRGERGEQQAWRRVAADDQGRPLDAGRVGWAACEVRADRDRVVLARLQRGISLWVNGEPHVGDYYGYGHGGVPVHLRSGTNRILVHGVRGRMGLSLLEPDDALLRAPWGEIRPDLLVGDDSVGPLGLVLMNASTHSLPHVEVLLEADELFEETRVSVPHGLAALDLAAVAVPQRLREGVTVPDGEGPWTRSLRWGGPAAGGWRRGELPLRRRAPTQPRRRTFVSAIDGTVQFYGLLAPDPEVPLDPAVDDPAVGPGEAAGLVLSLHGAGVDGMAQARSYSAKPDLWHVAPTNRSPFGFDWQDWGRQDAYEVLADALELSGVDRRRVSVTGHSMGGHGTWHLAANDPDGFAAVAPSAGWESFDSYGGRPEGALADLWQRADGASRTLDLLDNLVQRPVFVLHGEADDNVPASQGHDMVAALEAAGGTPASHFEPGKGHWWNGDAAPGADCLEWPGLIATLRGAELPEEPHEIRFTTVDPAVDCRHFWVSVVQPLRYGRPCRVEASWQYGVVTLSTENVRRLTLHRQPTKLVVDGQDVPLGRFHTMDGTMHLRRDDTWRHAPDGGLDQLLAAGEKTPERGGPFKRAANDGFVLVVGTRGSAAMNRQLHLRARQLAHEWWYRANGRAPILTDVQWLAQRPAGNPILLGNADCNAAWNAVLTGQAWSPEVDRSAWDGGLPVQVRRGQVAVGDQRWQGDDLATVHVLPRPGGLAGFLGFSGVEAVRASYVLAPWVSGVGYPDVTVYDGRVLEQGDGGVLAAGWCDALWRPVLEEL